MADLFLFKTHPLWDDCVQCSGFRVQCSGFRVQGFTVDQSRRVCLSGSGIAIGTGGGVAAGNTVDTDSDTDAGPEEEPDREVQHGSVAEPSSFRGTRFQEPPGPGPCGMVVFSVQCSEAGARAVPQWTRVGEMA
jgi:hypothetical protein